MLTFREHGEERAETTSREDFVGTVRAFVHVLLHGTRLVRTVDRPYVSYAQVRAWPQMMASIISSSHLVTVTVFL